MAETEPELVDAVTLEKLSQLTQSLPSGHRRYISQKFSLFSTAKENWRSQRIQSECKGFTNRMLELFAAGSAQAMPIGGIC